MDLLNKLFEIQKSKNTVANIDITNLGEHYVFEQILNNTNAAALIPTLSKDKLGHLRPNTLCSYRGIIQEIFDIEFYCGLHHDKLNDQFTLTKYMDTLPDSMSFSQYAEESSNSLTILSRLPILVSPIPMENSWALKLSNNDFNQADNLKRFSTRLKESGSTKRSQKLEEISMEPAKSLCREKDPIESNAESVSVLQSSTHSTSDTISQSQLSCVVKLYDHHTKLLLRILDLVEVFGIYTFDPILTETSLNGELRTTGKHDIIGTALNEGLSATDLVQISSTESMLENYECGRGSENDYGWRYNSCYDRAVSMDGVLPPVSLAPRLHCLVLRRLGSSFPLLAEVTETGLAYCPHSFYAPPAISPKLVPAVSTQDLNELIAYYFQIQTLARNKQNEPAKADSEVRMHFSHASSYNCVLKVIQPLSQINENQPDDIKYYKLTTPATSGIENSILSKDQMQHSRKILVTCIKSIFTKLFQSFESTNSNLDDNQAEVLSEYILLTLISHIYERNITQSYLIASQSTELLMGYLPLHICGLHPNDPRVLALHRLIQSVCARSELVNVDQMSLLQGSPLQPSRNNALNLTIPSPLFLAEGTVLLLDETKSISSSCSNNVTAATGKQERCATDSTASGPHTSNYAGINICSTTKSPPKTEKYVKSCQALQTMITSQYLSIPYPYFDARIPTNTSIIVLSTTAKESLFKDSNNLVRVTLPIVSSSSQSVALDNAFDCTLHELPCSISELNQLRMYIATCRIQHVGMNPRIISLAEQNFAELRSNIVTHQVVEKASALKYDAATNQDNFFSTILSTCCYTSSYQFHLWLTLARLIAISYGDDTITETHWNHMRRLESSRKANLSNEYTACNKIQNKSQFITKT